MAKGASVYITSAEIVRLIGLCRAQTDQIWLDYADKLEGISRKKFPDAKIPKRLSVRRAPICHVHKLPMVYDTRTDEHVCPSPGCPWRAYEDEEPHSEAARAYHQDVAEKSRDAAHGSSEHRRKREKLRRHTQDEGSFNAKRIPLKNEGRG